MREQTTMVKNGGKSVNMNIMLRGDKLQFSKSYLISVSERLYLFKQAMQVLMRCCILRQNVGSHLGLNCLLFFSQERVKGPPMTCSRQHFDKLTSFFSKNIQCGELKKEEKKMQCDYKEFNGRVLDWKSRVCGFEPHPRHCSVNLSKTH